MAITPLLDLKNGARSRIIHIARVSFVARRQPRTKSLASRSSAAMPDIVRQPGARLTGKVDPRLAKRFYPGPLAHLRRSYGAFHAFDKAHTVALAEAGLIP